MDRPAPSHAALARAVEAIRPFVMNEPTDEAEEAWTAFEAELRDPSGDDHPLASLVRSLELSSFETKTIAALLALHVGGGPHAPSARWLLSRLCRTTEARVAGLAELQPSGRLARHHVVVAGSSGGNPAEQPVMLAPAMRNFLLNDGTLSARVASVARFVHERFDLLDVIMPTELRDQARELVLAHDGVRARMAAWGASELVPTGTGVTLLVSGPSGTGKTLFARALATHMEAPLLAVSCSDLPEQGTEQLLRDVYAEARLRRAVVLLDECETVFGTDSRRKAAGLNALDSYADGVTLLITNHPEQLADPLDRRILLHVPFERPTAEQRRQIWEVHLPPEMPVAEDVDLDVLADRYEVTGGQIKNALQVAATRAVFRPEATGERLTMALLEHGCRSQLRSALEELTTRTVTSLRLADIVLPDRQRSQVEGLVAAIRDHSFVMNTWGLRDRLATGTGIAALFDGPPGTGKTMCAEIIAGEVGQPLHRVNLPQVVSKWVGETEKHIQAIFAQARASRAMLLFDEADSLFAARSKEVKSSNDRYANMEVNLLLQEIERFPGVAILTTNSWGAMDDALMRRILFRIRFEEPDPPQREEIWRKLCGPKLALAADVDFGELARTYDYPGGRIKNALLKAAYAAAKSRSAVTQAILREACADEAQAAGLAIRDPERRAEDLARRAALLARMAREAEDDAA